MRWLPFAILGSLVLEAISALIERYAVHVGQHEVIPEFRVFQYGYIWNDWPHVGREREAFFILHLPSYDWQLVDYRDRWGWCRLYVMWTSTSGWRTGYVPCKGSL